MKKIFTVIMVTAVAVALLTPALALACDKSKTETAATKASKAVLADADCQAICQQAFATATAGKEDCCKAAVAAAMKAHHGMKVDAAGVVASVKTAESSCCASKQATAALKDCCKECIAAFEVAFSKGMAAAGCSAKATTAVAGTRCEGGAAAMASTSCSVKNTAALAGSGCDKSKSAAHATAMAGGTSCSTSKTALSYASINGREGKKVVLTGDAACAKCTFGAEACQALIQTADGKVYRVINDDRYNKLKNTESEKGFQITTRIREVDGEKVLEIERVKAL